MANSSHIPNFTASGKIQNVQADFSSACLYNANMARRGIPKGPVIWYLREWMASKDIVKQTQMMKRTGWSKAKMSQLYNAQQDFNSEILIEAANALHIHPYELLMHPDAANHLRTLQKTGLAIAADTKKGYLPPPMQDETPTPTRRKKAS